MDFSEVDKLTAAPKTEDDFDKITSKCLVLAIEVGAKGKTDADDDPDYWKHCTVGPARARANLVIKESTPEKMHTQCLAASVQADTIVESKKAEAEEFKKLGAQIDKACGL